MPSPSRAPFALTALLTVPLLGAAVPAPGSEVVALDKFEVTSQKRTEAIENVPAKFFKETDVWVKTKTPVLMIRTDNEIPKESSR